MGSLFLPFLSPTTSIPPPQEDELWEEYQAAATQNGTAANEKQPKDGSGHPDTRQTAGPGGSPLSQRR